MDYLIVKTLHILSATILVGTGFGSAFTCFGPTAAAQSPPKRWWRAGSSGQTGG